MSVKGFNRKVKLDTENNLQIISHNNLYLYDKESDKIENKREDENSLHHRSNWNPSQGDFIVEPLKIKRKIFKKEDLRNFITGLWYILLSLLIVYVVMNFLAKIG